MLFPTLTEATFYVNNGVQLLLATYFGKKYLDTGVKACVSWALGFLSYAASGIFFEMIKDGIFAFNTTNLFLRAGLMAAGLAFFYHGVSLLFFEKDFFKQEGITLGLFAIMFSVNAYYAHAAQGNVANLVHNLNITYVYIFIFPMFTIISSIFYHIYRRLPRGDPRRKNMFLLFLAWLGLAIFNLLYPITYATEYHWFTRTGTTASRLLLLYGMVYAEI